MRRWTRRFGPGLRFRTRLGRRTRRFGPGLGFWARLRRRTLRFGPGLGFRTGLRRRACWLGCWTGLRSRAYWLWCGSRLGCRTRLGRRMCWLRCRPGLGWRYLFGGLGVRRLWTSYWSLRTRRRSGLLTDGLSVIRGYAGPCDRLVGTHTRLVGPCGRLIRPCGWYRRRWPCAWLPGSGAGCGPCDSGCRMRLSADARIHRCGRDVDGTRLDGTRRDQRCGLAAVEADILLAVLHGLVAMLHLCGHRTNVLLAHGSELTLRGTHIDAAAAAVVADARIVVHDHGAVVDVGDVRDVDVVDGAVVHEAVMVPVAAVVAGTGIAVAVGNSTVEADMRAPVAGVPAIEAAEEAPPRGRP